MEDKIVDKGDGGRLLGSPGVTNTMGVGAA